MYSKCNCDIRIRAKLFCFGFFGLFLLSLAELSSSESNFLKSSYFLVVDRWSRLDFSENLIPSFTLGQTTIVATALQLGFVQISLSECNFLKTSSLAVFGLVSGCVRF